jgi:hypothetical protein
MGPTHTLHNGIQPYFLYLDGRFFNLRKSHPAFVAVPDREVFCYLGRT